MRVTCPGCHAEHALEVLIGREAEARAVAQLLERGLPFGGLVLRYIALFRPGKRRLGLDRMAALITELLPDIERRAITRKGRDWAAPVDVWQASIEAVLAARDKGTLTLPLTSHGYLYEVICAQADKAEAAAERQTEEERRNHRRAGTAPAVPASVASVINADPPAPTVPPPSGPSKAALRIKAEMVARMRKTDSKEQQ